MTTSLLFYRASDGKGGSYTIDLQGKLPPTHAYTDFASDWDKIIAVETTWDAYERKARSDILFHRGQSGSGSGWLYGVGDAGELKLLRSQNVLSRGWTDIVPVAFEHQTHILFYDKTTAASQVRRYVSSSAD